MACSGDCQREGIYAPLKEDGEIDLSKRTPLKEGEPFPDQGEWIQVGYLVQPSPKSRPSLE